MRRPRAAKAWTPTATAIALASAPVRASTRRARAPIAIPIASSGQMKPGSAAGSTRPRRPAGESASSRARQPIRDALFGVLPDGSRGGLLRAMSKSGIKLLRAASDVVGGMPELALRLKTSETLLAKYMIGYRRLPDTLLLKVLDLILAERESGQTPARSEDLQRRL